MVDDRGTEQKRARIAPDKELDRIAATLARTSGPSSLYQWLRRRHDSFAEHVGTVRPNWAALATEFAALGLTDSSGQAATAERVRKTWWRVRRDVALVGRSVPTEGPKEAPEPGAFTSVRLPTPPALPYPASEEIEDVWTESEFKPARLKGRGPGSAIDGEAK